MLAANTWLHRSIGNPTHLSMLSLLLPAASARCNECTLWAFPSAPPSPDAFSEDLLCLAPAGRITTVCHWTANPSQPTHIKSLPRLFTGTLSCYYQTSQSCVFNSRCLRAHCRNGLQQARRHPLKRTACSRTRNLQEKPQSTTERMSWGGRKPRKNGITRKTHQSAVVASTASYPAMAASPLKNIVDRFKEAWRFGSAEGPEG